MDFSNYLFRCSSLGKLMTGVKPALTANQVAEMDRLLQKQSEGKITEKQTITLGELLAKKHAPETLSETTIKELQKIHREELTKRSKEIRTKYTDKGIQTEERSRTLYSFVTGEKSIRNRERLSNEWITGLPDDRDFDWIEYKSSWDLSTFPLYEDTCPNTDYEWQVDGYMMIENIPSFKIVYALNDTPFKIIDDELRRLDWQHNIYNQEGDVRPESIPLVVETISNMVFTDKGLREYCQQSSSVELEWFDGFREIPECLRLKIFIRRRDYSRDEMIKKQVPKWRNYLNSLGEKIAAQLSVEYETVE